MYIGGKLCKDLRFNRVFEDVYKLNPKRKYKLCIRSTEYGSNEFYSLSI